MSTRYVWEKYTTKGGLITTGAAESGDISVRNDWLNMYVAESITVSGPGASVTLHNCDFYCFASDSEIVRCAGKYHIRMDDEDDPYGKRNGVTISTSVSNVFYGGSFTYRPNDSSHQGFGHLTYSGQYRVKYDTIKDASTGMVSATSNTAYPVNGIGGGVITS